MYCLKQVCINHKFYCNFLFIYFMVCINNSFYIICLRYETPAKIQSELLDIKHSLSVDAKDIKVWRTCHPKCSCCIVLIRTVVCHVGLLYHDYRSADLCNWTEKTTLFGRSHHM